MEALLKAEQKMFSRIMIENYEPISNCCNNDKAKEDLENYLQEEFGLSMMQKWEGWDKPMVNRDFYLPRGLTIEQIRKIREASQIHFYELVQITENNSFWGIRCGKNTPKAGEWVTISACRSENGNWQSAQIPIYFNNKADTQKRFGYAVSSFLSNVEIKGSLEELSDTPTLLSAFIEKTDKIDVTTQMSLIIKGVLGEIKIGFL